MAAAADRDLEVELAAEANGGDDIVAFVGRTIVDGRRSNIAFQTRLASS